MAANPRVIISRQFVAQSDNLVRRPRNRTSRTRFPRTRLIFARRIRHATNRC